MNQHNRQVNMHHDFFLSADWFNCFWWKTQEVEDEGEE